MDSEMADLLAVFFLGALVGAGELVSRFRDEPTRAITSFPGLLYLTINGIASVTALVALWTFVWTPAPESVEQTRMLRILASGFGAMAVFRTALFTVRISGTDIGVGPVAFLQIMLAAIDRAVDRKRARERAERVLSIMEGITFTDLFASLPAFVFALMQNLSPDDKAAIKDEVKALAESPMPDEAKALNLGLLLMNFVGEGVVEEAVKGLKKQLKITGRSGFSAAIERFLSKSGSDSGGRPPIAPPSSGAAPPESAGTTATIDQAVVEARPPSEEATPPPGTTAHGTSMTDAAERLGDEERGPNA